MGLLDFLRRQKPVARTATPSAVVRFDDDAVTCTRSNGHTETVRWSDLQAVIVHTTADGPFSDDLFWVLVAHEGGCVVPSEAVGCDRLLKRLQELPGFD
jgi:hypothetical protein